MSEPSLSSITIYQLRVVLCGVSPLVWRRLLVASDTTIAELHEILQSAFDWSGERLHRFLIHGAAYGIRCLGGIGFREDARRVPLSRFVLHCGEHFRYEYDFMADWTLDIRLEKALPFDQDRALPSCIGGSRAAPPEDCAGAWDYLERLDRHKYQPPIEELGIMAEAMQRFLDSDGNRHAIGDLDELREAVDRVQPIRISNQPSSTGENSTVNCGCWPKIVRCGDDLQDSSGYHRRGGHEETCELACLERTDLKPETLGLTLAEGKMILKGLQQIVVERQVSSSLLPKRACPDCGQPRSSKGNHSLSLRTVFGQLTVRSPRLHHCTCRPHQTKTFSPLAELLPEHITPELLFLETKWASLMSYGMTSKLLQEVLPIDEPVNAFTIRQHVADVAERLERELGDEQCCFIEGCQRDWDRLPPPDGPLTVGIDGGFIRAPQRRPF